MVCSGDREKEWVCQGGNPDHLEGAGHGFIVEDTFPIDDAEGCSLASAQITADHQEQAEQ